MAKAMETMEEETGSDRIPAASAREWIAEWARENRRRQHALLLTTAHGAKGLEFDHVVILDGNWNSRNTNEAEEQRRLYYVAMTRARHTLTLIDAGNATPSSSHWRDTLPCCSGNRRRTTARPNRSLRRSAGD